ncbi:MAG: O-antigen ligase family protein, partial [Alphaproteobacteria bacterium]
TLGELVRGRGLYYHPNRLAEFVEQVGMLLVACAVLGPWRAACAAGALLATAGVWASGSAASIAVMAGGGLVVSTGLLAWNAGHLGRWRREPTARRGFAIGVAGLALAGAAAALVARRAWVAHGGLGSRGRVYALASRVIRDHPWLGVGAGNWPFEANGNPLDRFWFTSHTHSIVLQLWAELGVVGLIAGAVTLLALPVLALRAAGHAPRAWRGVTVGAALGVLALVAHDVVHWFLRVAADGLPTGVLLGLAAAAWPGADPDADPGPDPGPDPGAS